MYLYLIWESIQYEWFWLTQDYTVLCFLKWNMSSKVLLLKLSQNGNFEIMHKNCLCKLTAANVIYCYYNALFRITQYVKGHLLICLYFSTF